MNRRATVALECGAASLYSITYTVASIIHTVAAACIFFHHTVLNIAAAYYSNASLYNGQYSVLKLGFNMSGQ